MSYPFRIEFGLIQNQLNFELDPGHKEAQNFVVKH